MASWCLSHRLSCLLIAHKAHCLKMISQESLTHLPAMKISHTSITGFSWPRNFRIQKITTHQLKSLAMVRSMRSIFFAKVVEYQSPRFANVSQTQPQRRKRKVHIIQHSDPRFKPSCLKGEERIPLMRLSLRWSRPLTPSSVQPPVETILSVPLGHTRVITIRPRRSTSSRRQVVITQ